MFYVLHFADGSHQHSTLEYGTTEEAETWQSTLEARLGRSGTLYGLPTWEATIGAATVKNAALETKFEALKREAERRLPDDFPSIDTLRAIIKADGVNPDPEVVYAKAVWNAAKQAYVQISQLATPQAIMAYDVANTPTWPAPL